MKSDIFTHSLVSPATEVGELTGAGYNFLKSPVDYPLELLFANLLIIIIIIIIITLSAVMVARRSLGARFRFLNAEWICWRCALKSTHQYKAILQQSTTIVPEIPRKCGIQKASQDPLATDRVVAQLESLSRPVKKNRAYSTESSRSSLQTTPEESLASTVRDPPNVVTRRGSHLSLRRRGKYYTTSAVGGASRS